MFKESKFEHKENAEVPEQKNATVKKPERNSLGKEKVESLSDLSVGKEKEKEGRELETDFAQELREAVKHKFFKKLQKLAGAFALAGLFIFSPQESVAPEATKEARAVCDIDYTAKYQPELYREILEQLKEKGGISFSPQFPDTVYKPKEISGEARLTAISRGKFIYNRPEVMLGKEFIKENPEKAEKMCKKISETIKSTARLLREDRGSGSGVIIKGKENKLLVLTNAHVCGEDEKLWAYLSDGGPGRSVKVIAKDRGKDLAVLEFFDENEEKPSNLATLKIGKSSGIKLFGREETIASVGNPLGFPFAAGIGKRTPTILGRAILGLDDDYIFYQADKRFSHLELYSGIFQDVEIDWDEFEKSANEKIRDEEDLRKYYLKIFKTIETKKFFNKGDSIPGMSGGPIVSLDAEGEPELIGINRGHIRDKGEAVNKYGVGISSSAIIDFLRTNDLI